MCACTCRAPVSSCFSLSVCVGPVTAVHSSRRWRTGCVLARCQPDFFKCRGTFNAVGEFATRRNHRVLSVPWRLSWPQSCVRTKTRRVRHTYRKHWCAFKQRECVRGWFWLAKCLMTLTTAAFHSNAPLQGWVFCKLALGWLVSVCLSVTS